MTEEEMIPEEQIEQETALEEVENYEEQTEQDATNSLDDILAGVNELLEQSASYNAYLEDFYPRSPCGERRAVKISCAWSASISIHALLAESDPGHCAR